MKNIMLIQNDEFIIIIENVERLGNNFFMIWKMKTRKMILITILH